MKKFLLIIIAVIGIVGCQKKENPFFEVSPITDFNFSATGDSVELIVKSNVTWRIQLGGNYHITATPDVGTGNAVVKVKATANVTSSELRSSVAFIPEGFSEVIMWVTQSAGTLGITAITPNVAGGDDIIIISGNAFSPIKERNIVKINGIEVPVLLATHSQLKVRVPKNKNCTGAVTVSTDGTTVQAGEMFTYIPKLMVYSFAGGGPYGRSGSSDGIGINAGFSTPFGITVSPTGVLYIAEYEAHRIRKMDAQAQVNTFAGENAIGLVDGAAAVARFRYPTGITTDASGNIYVADYMNHRIRKITPNGVVSTLAGSGAIGVAGGGYAEGLATIQAQFKFPTGVAVDKQGNIYVADQGNHRIRKIAPAGVVSTFAGSGIAGFSDGTGAGASFRSPGNLYMDNEEVLYVAETGNHSIRRITKAGVVTTVAGSGTSGYANGNGRNAMFNTPYGMCKDVEGNLYVVDRLNACVRKITPAGDVSLFAGTCSMLVSYKQSSPALEIDFYSPVDIVIDANGDWFVTESGFHCIRKICWE